MTRLFQILIALAGAAAIVALAFAGREMMQPKVRSFPLRYLSGAEAADLLSGHVPPGAVEHWSDKAVFVSGRRSDMETVATVLQAEDKPKPQVKLRFQVIEADGPAARDAAIEKVESALRQLFRFEGYKLIAEAYIQSRAESEATQTITGSDGVDYMIQLKVDNVARRQDKASAEISVTLWTNFNTPAQQAPLSTAVQVPHGQTVVLGTARMNKDRGALILVVTPEIQ